MIKKILNQSKNCNLYKQYLFNKYNLSASPYYSATPLITIYLNKNDQCYVTEENVYLAYKLLGTKDINLALLNISNEDEGIRKICKNLIGTKENA